ncbi:hypothetical protein BDW02DRAFT_242555 [Decorospora gaudefroyi]|uniref:Uncharacterized protein n=1 Tax=Decorospora gaudefroyi TaxID=184978 RepID=A0A6A5KRX5_9PLEO|nr:hypothetical protein BDW02DRAFT_242555 [Decorospora gaudefroyi]
MLAPTASPAQQLPSYTSRTHTKLSHCLPLQVSVSHWAKLGSPPPTKISIGLRPSPANQHQKRPRSEPIKYAQMGTLMTLEKLYVVWISDGDSECLRRILCISAVCLGVQVRVLASMHTRPFSDLVRRFRPALFRRSRVSRGCRRGAAAWWADSPAVLTSESYDFYVLRTPTPRCHADALFTPDFPSTTPCSEADPDKQ